MESEQGKQETDFNTKMEDGKEPNPITHAGKREREDEGGQIETNDSGDTTTTAATDDQAKKRSKLDDTLDEDKKIENADNKLNGKEEASPTNGRASHESSSGKTSPIITRRRAQAAEQESAEAASEEEESSESSELFPKGYNNKGPRINGRWRVHQMTEDYVNFVAKMMYPATEFRPFGYDINKRQYPIEGISVLGFLKSPLRRPTVIEKWSPYEIAMFEGALLHHGKEFHLVSREIGSKSTKDVIDFYYTWKKTAHYQRWKQKFISDAELDIITEQHSREKNGGKTIK